MKLKVFIEYPVSKLVLGHHCPHNSNPPLLRSWSSNVGPTTVLQLLKLYCWSNVGTMSARQQWGVANNSNHYQTLAQRLLAIWVTAFLTISMSLQGFRIWQLCVVYLTAQQLVNLLYKFCICICISICKLCKYNFWIPGIKFKLS